MTDKRPLALAIRQVRFKGLASLEQTLVNLGYRVEYVDAPEEDLFQVDPAAPDLLVFLGGPPGALDEDRFPFLADELRLIEARLDIGRPLLGICLGGQLIARVLGAEIQPGAAPELGWWPLSLSREGRDSPLRFLSEVPVLHWHSDAMSLPADARLLASTDRCPVQAFQYGLSTLALQFHPEVSAPAMEQWLVAHMRQIDAHPRHSVESLRDDAHRCADWMAQRADAMLRDWLNEVNEVQLGS